MSAVNICIVFAVGPYSNFDTNNFPHIFLGYIVLLWLIKKSCCRMEPANMYVVKTEYWNCISKMCNFPTLDGQKTKRNTSIFTFSGVSRAHNGFTIVPVGLKTRSVGEHVAQGHRCSSLHYISDKEQSARLCESFLCLLDAHFDIFLSAKSSAQTDTLYLGIYYTAPLQGACGRSLLSLWGKLKLIVFFFSSRYLMYNKTELTECFYVCVCGIYSVSHVLGYSRK